MTLEYSQHRILISYDTTVAVLKFKFAYQFDPFKKFLVFVYI